MTIVTVDDPRASVLREPCKPVTPDMLPQVAAWAAEMHALCVTHGGIGLAANQVGLPWRFFIESVNRNGGYVVMVNPEIVSGLGPRAVVTEGCLSNPGVFRGVARHGSVAMTVGTLIRSITPGVVIAERRLTAHGMRACCWQHEMDHLDGRDPLGNNFGVQP